MPLIAQEARAHKHGPGQTAPYWVLSSECVVVVVGNYEFAMCFTRSLHLGMHLRFRNPRRSQVAPIGNSILKRLQYTTPQRMPPSTRPEFGPRPHAGS